METNTREFDELMRKIAGIQALIERGATTGEVEAATSRMQALLTKHALSYELIADRIGTGTDRREIIIQQYDLGGRDTWRRSLMDAITKANFGRSIFTAGDSRVRIIADREQYRVIAALYEFLAPTVDALAETHWSIAVMHHETRGANGRTWKTSFRLGAVNGIRDAMNKARGNAAAEVNSSALVVIRDEEVERASRSFVPRQRSTTVRYGDSAAYGRGRREGANIHLGGQVGGRRSTAIG